MRVGLRFHVLSCVLGGAAFLGFGCFGNGHEPEAASGDPAADRRAEMIVESSGNDAGKAGKSRTLFERLGGDAGIGLLVDDITARVVADPRVNFDRSNVRKTWYGGAVTVWRPTAENIDRFKRHLGEFISLAAGGPAQYTGGDMRAVHKDMRITNAEFDAMLGDVIASMDRLGYKEAEKTDLVAIIETTRKQIVEQQ